MPKKTPLKNLTLDDKVDNLTSTVNTLSGTVNTLATTVNNQSKRIDNVVNYMIQGFDKVDKKIEAYRDEIVVFKNEVFDRMDKIYGEVKTMREEQSFHQQTHDDINERFNKIETIPVIAHELKKKKI